MPTWNSFFSSIFSGFDFHICLHFRAFCKIKVKVKVAQSRPTLWPHGLYSPWNSPGQNTRVSSHSLLLWLFPTQGSNPGLLHCRWILYQLSYEGSPLHYWLAKYDCSLVHLRKFFIFSLNNSMTFFLHSKTYRTWTDEFPTFKS